MIWVLLLIAPAPVSAAPSPGGSVFMFVLSPRAAKNLARARATAEIPPSEARGLAPPATGAGEGVFPDWETGKDFSWEAPQARHGLSVWKAGNPGAPLFSCELRRTLEAAREVVYRDLRFSDDLGLERGLLLIAPAAPLNQRPLPSTILSRRVEASKMGPSVPPRRRASGVLDGHFCELPFPSGDLSSSRDVRYPGCPLAVWAQGTLSHLRSCPGGMYRLPAASTRHHPLRPLPAA
jgi:hypothetical protein